MRPGARVPRYPASGTRCITFCCRTPAWRTTATRPPSNTKPENFRAHGKAWRQDASANPLTAEEIGELQNALRPRGRTLGAARRATGQATASTPKTRCRYGPTRWIDATSRRTPNEWKDRKFAEQGRVQRRHPHGQPLPPPEAGDGLLVRPLVLAHRRGGTAADAGPVLERGEPGAKGLRLPARPGAEPNGGSVRSRSMRNTPPRLVQRITNEIGMLDLDSLFEQFPRLKFVDETGQTAEVSSLGTGVCRHCSTGEAVRTGTQRGGFDLVLGNPPWIKVEWKEAGVLGDFDPIAGVAEALGGGTDSGARRGV